MNYQRIYDEFIADRRIKEPSLTGYTEKHHVLPRSLGGDNSKENLIKLSAQDHYFAHELLAKIHKGKMSNALWMMTNSKKYKASRLMYQSIREQHVKEVSPKLIKAITGRKKSQDEINKISQSLRVYFKNNPDAIKGRTFTDEAKRKLSASLKEFYKDRDGSRKGKKQTPQAIKKQRDYMLSDKNHFRGKSLSESQRKKIGDAQRGCKNHSYKNQQYKFYHSIHGEFTGTQNDLVKVFSVPKTNASRLCLGCRKVSSGWSILEKLDA